MGENQATLPGSWWRVSGKQEVSLQGCIGRKSWLSKPFGLSSGPWSYYLRAAASPQSDQQVGSRRGRYFLFYHQSRQWKVCSRHPGLSLSNSAHVLGMLVISVLHEVFPDLFGTHCAYWQVDVYWFAFPTTLWEQELCLTHLYSLVPHKVGNKCIGKLNQITLNIVTPRVQLCIQSFLGDWTWKQLNI